MAGYIASVFRVISSVVSYAMKQRNKECLLSAAELKQRNRFRYRAPLFSSSLYINIPNALPLRNIEP